MIKLKRFTIVIFVCVITFLFINYSHAAFREILHGRQFNDNYYRLEQAYNYYQSIQSHSWPEITGILLKKGQTQSEVSLIRERLHLIGDLPASAETKDDYFDEALEQAVKGFQWRHGLNPDGVVGAKTLAELNVPPSERAEQIRRNMDRWAELPTNLGYRFIFINIPEYRFDLIEDGHSVLNMKVIVGKPDRPTPELNSEINLIELNPYWNIPPSIVMKDILPKILNDPNYLQDMDIKVVQRRGSEVIPIDESQIDWEEVYANGFDYDLRQEPGKNNALGMVKFDFPNKYHVYMHDTPAKELFNNETRAFSSGCIRLEKPFALLSYIIQDIPEWDASKVVEAVQSGKLTYIKLHKPIPIYIIYATAWVDKEGILFFRPDPYGYNQEPDPDDEFSQAMLDEELALPLSFYA